MPASSRPTKGSSTSSRRERTDERDRDRRLLTQAAAERGGQLVETIGEPERADEVFRGGGPVAHAVHAGDELEVLAQREVVVERGLVGEVGELGARLDRPARLAVHLDRAARGVEQAGEHAHEGGLAAAVVAHQRDELAGGHLEVERCERRAVAVGAAVRLGEAAHGEGGCC